MAATAPSAKNVPFPSFITLPIREQEPMKVFVKRNPYAPYPYIFNNVTEIASNMDNENCFLYLIHLHKTKTKNSVNSISKSPVELIESYSYRDWEAKFYFKNITMNKLTNGSGPALILISHLNANSMSKIKINNPRSKKLLFRDSYEQKTSNLVSALNIEQLNLRSRILSKREHC